MAKARLKRNAVEGVDDPEDGGFGEAPLPRTPEQRRLALLQLIAALFRHAPAGRSRVTTSTVKEHSRYGELYFDDHVVADDAGLRTAGMSEAAARKLENDINWLIRRGWLEAGKGKPRPLTVTTLGQKEAKGEMPSPATLAIAYRFAKAYAPSEIRDELARFYMWAQGQMVVPAKNRNAVDQNLLFNNIEVTQKGLRQQEPRYRYAKGSQELLDALYKAIGSRCEMRIQYRNKRSGKSGERVSRHRVRPLSIVFRHPKVYLVAANITEPDKAPMIREYSLNRIVDLETYNVQFTRPENYSLEARINQRGLESDSDADGERVIERLVLRIYNDTHHRGYARSRVIDDVMETPPVCREMVLEKDQYDDGSVRLTLKGIRDTQELRQWILSRIPSVVVEEPDGVRESVAGLVELISDRTRRI